MAYSSRVKNICIGIIGSGSIAQNHADAFARIPGAKIVAAASPTEKNVRAFARRNGLTQWFTDWRRLAGMKGLDLVTIGSPNHLHADQTIVCLEHGKHVVCEKPLCLALEEADAVLEAAKRTGRRVFYAENLCFIPKAVRMKEIVDAGAIGRPYLVKEWEKHAGPYSPWFFKRETAGGGIMMDMGCHAIEFARWLVGKPKVKSVTAHCGRYLHGGRTDLDDTVIIIMEFEGGGIAHVEASWALLGGMDSEAECHGTGGVIYADMFRGTGVRCFSENGYDLGGPPRRGWHTPEYDTPVEHGYAGEMRHFVDCIRTGKKPVESAEDGKVVLEIMLAAYHSAGTGRRVTLPFRPKGVKYPVDLWLGGVAGLLFLDNSLQRPRDPE